VKSHLLLLVVLLGAAALVAPSNAHADGPTLTITAGACNAEVEASLSGVPPGTEVLFMLAEVGSHTIDEAARSTVGDEGRLVIRIVLNGSYSIDGECRAGQRYGLTAGERSSKGGLEESIVRVFFTIGGNGEVLLPAPTGGAGPPAPTSDSSVLVVAAVVLVSLLPVVRVRG
jgi:hypothetical protein